MDSENYKEFDEEFDEEEIKQFNLLPEAAQNDLLYKFDKINHMKTKEVVDKLMCFHLNSQGSIEDLRSRLKNAYKKLSFATVDLVVSKNLLPYYVVIDFEATCEETNPQNYRHEIIEFPAVIVNSKKQEITDCFQMYCKPSINPVISEFCTELTGISQEKIDSAECFENVFKCFQNWLAKHNLGKKQKFAIVTDGPWDMCRFLFSQCHYSNVQFPKWGTKWVNLKKSFGKFYKCERFGLKNMLEFLNMDFAGRPHCGLDDSKNIARILLKMIYDGANIQINERITEPRKGSENKNKYAKNKDLVNGTLESSNLESNEKRKEEKVEAHYATIYNVSKMPIYKEVKREKAINEAHLARKLFKNSKDSDVNFQHYRKQRSLKT